MTNSSACIYIVFFFNRCSATDLRKMSLNVKQAVLTFRQLAFELFCILNNYPGYSGWFFKECDATTIHYMTLYLKYKITSYRETYTHKTYKQD